MSAAFFRAAFLLGVFPVLELLFPSRCLACGGRGRARFGLCSACLEEVRWEGAAGCVRCGRRGCGRGCVPLHHQYRRVLAVAAYQQSWRSLVLALKHGRDTRVARELGQAMGELALIVGMPQPEVVMPAPAAVSRRPYQLARLLAEEVALQLGAELEAGLLRRPGRPPQVELDRSSRLEGLSDYLMLREWARVAGRRVLLVDDVFTTGGTAAACTEVLLAAGAAGVWVLVAAA